MMAERHKEILIKVNVWIDEGVVPLVLALNDFDDVFTHDSCQGDEDKPAHVFFSCRQSEDTVAFVSRLAEALKTVSNWCDYQLELDWPPDRSCCMARLSCSPEAVPHLTKAVQSLWLAVRKEILGELAALGQELGVGY